MDKPTLRRIGMEVRDRVRVNAPCGFLVKADFAIRALDKSKYFLSLYANDKDDQLIDAAADYAEKAVTALLSGYHIEDDEQEESINE